MTAAPASSTPPPAATLAPATRLVGRDQAVERLRAPLEAALGGAGQAAVVSGDAGIGKTRVAHEIAGAATALGARVLWGRCHEADVSPAYWPWIPVVRELAGQHPAAPVAELLSPSPGGRGGGDADSAALRTFDAVVGVVAAAAAGGPLVVVLEDVHWAASASLRLLAYAAEALRDVPVLLLVTFRATREPGPALQACLAALGRLSAVRVPLGGLSGAHVRDLVRHLVGPDVTEELTDVVAERTDGNPFFVIELVRLLLAEHRLHATGARDVDVPDGVRDVLRLRLGRLPEPVGRLLGTAAVVGRDFSLDLLAAVAATDPDDVLDALDAAVAAHLVEEGHAPGRYRFTHALVRETLYGALSLVRRGRMHAAIAVAQEPALAGDPELVTELAHHFVLGAAVRPELAAPAVQHATAAAARAEARGALDQALGHWEQALSADALAPQTDLRRRHGVLLGLGRARYRRGDVVGSREALDAAVALGRSLADVELVAQAATSFRGAGVWHWREFGTSDPAMVAVLQECVASLPPGPLHARSLASLAMELVYEWRSEAADAVSTRAVEAARAVADADLLADVIGLRTLTLWGRPGAATQRLALAAEVLALPLSREQELYTRFGAAAAHLQLGEAAEADRQMTRCVELTRRLRHTGADVPIAWWFFYRAVARGDEDAERLGHQAIERHRRSSVVAIVDMEPMARLRLPGPDGGGSRVQEADVRLAAGHANPAFRAVVAHALACAGRAAEGVELLGPPVPEGAWDYASVYGDCLRVDVLAAAGRTDALPEALDRIAAWGHEFAVYGSTDCVGSIDYFVGRGLEALGDRDGAAAAYRRAADRNREAGVRRWQERAETRLAALDPQPAGPR